MSNRSYEFDSSKAVNDELEDLNRELELIELLLKKHSLKPLDDIEVRAAALSLSTVYNGIETIIIFLLKARDVTIPTGSRYHSQLLELAETQDIIDKEMKVKFQKFMAFRHFIRHSYSFEINPPDILKILVSCPELLKSFERRIQEIGR